MSIHDNTGAIPAAEPTPEHDAESTPVFDAMQQKSMWLRGGMMNGDDDSLIAALLEILPTTAGLDASGMQQLDRARAYMTELWQRGVSLNEFIDQTGINGAPVDELPEGFTRQKVVGTPGYFRFLLADLTSGVCADGLKAILSARLASVPAEWASQIRLLFFVDIDSDNKEYPSPYHCGLTPHAVRFDVALPDVEDCFNAIDDACAIVAKNSQQKIRIGIGRFGPHEYVGMRDGNLYSKRMPFNMGSDWILVKNICRRSGKNSWFWRLLAKRADRHDNG